MLEDQSIVITGGAGFLGSHLAERLCERNRVKLLDIDVHTNSINWTTLPQHPNIELVKADVCDAEVVRRELSACNYVVHLAALLGVQRVVDNARQTMDTIVVGTRNVLEASARVPNLKRLVNVSTSEIYGNTASHGETAPASISAANDPRMSYAAAKLLGEHMAWAYHRDLHLPVVNVRPFNVFGPLRKTSNAVSAFIARALAGADLCIHGQGNQLRSWCYIDDFTNGLLACLDHDAAVGEDFNLGNSLTTCTVYDLAERIVRLSGSASKICLVPHPFTDINVRAPCGDKATRLLDFHPRIHLDEGLQRTIAWYRTQRVDVSHWL